MEVPLAMQRTQVQSVVWKDPTCPRAVKPLLLDPVLCNKTVAPTCCNQRKPTCSNEDPAQPKIKTLIN